jgi:Concanavalin A-like lectin/glucanases superfamily
MSITIGPGITVGAGVEISSEIVPVSAGLQLYLDAGNPASYPGSGSTWTDLVAAKAFTLYNSPAYSSNNGGYLNFDPASSQWASATSLPSSLTTWTVEAWHYYAGTNSAGSPCIVTEAFAGGPINYTVGNCTDSSPNVQVGYWDGSSFHATPTGTVLTVGQWYQVVGTYNGTANQLYLNGAFVSSTASASVPGSSGVGIYLMSRWDNAQYWGGRLGIVRIYNAALTTEQVTQNFNANRSRFGL